MKLPQRTKLLLLGILFLAAAFRIIGINWDQGHYLHPDERAIVMAILKISYPTSIDSFFSPASPWNPNFFAYGSLPFYALKFVADAAGYFNHDFATYAAMYIPGRLLSTLSDLGTIVLLFFVGRKLFSARVGLLAAFFYAISVLPIQLSHFYAVDTLLTFFSLGTVYHLLCFYEKPTVKRALVIGLFLGLSLATKISAVVLLVAIGAALAADFALVVLKQPHKPKVWLPHFSAFAKRIVLYAGSILVAAGVTYVICAPYAIIDFKNFWLQTQQQSAMTHNAFTFPYTLQYVGKIPYLYELKNIFFYGMGPLLGLFALAGFFYFFYITLEKGKNGNWAKEAIVLVYLLTYFYIVGAFAIGFMRYMLPLYPFLALFAAVFFVNVLKKYIVSDTRKYLVVGLTGFLLLIWPLSFEQIYTKENTRVTASEWMNQYIPPGKTLAQEHWDDGLPLFGGEKYQFVTLALYDPDTPEKWSAINAELQQTDYIILASNRLYVPLQKLTDCEKLPPDKCYPTTAKYYHDLFSGQRGFQKVAEFSNNPTVPLLGLEINDQGADESFTVYDHPKVMIFKKQ